LGKAWNQLPPRSEQENGNEKKAGQAGDEGVSSSVGKGHHSYNPPICLAYALDVNPPGKRREGIQGHEGGPRSVRIIRRSSEHQIKGSDIIQEMQMSRETNFAGIYARVVLSLTS